MVVCALARAQVRLQAGPGAGLALSATPTHFLNSDALSDKDSVTPLPRCCDFDSHCLHRYTHAGVAAESTHLATTEHRVHARDLQLAVDATIVSALHCDGSPHQGAEGREGDSSGCLGH